MTTTSKTCAMVAFLLTINCIPVKSSTTELDKDGLRIHLEGPFPDDHGYLVAQNISLLSSNLDFDEFSSPVCEINRFAASLLCSLLFPDEERTLTWFGSAHNTSYLNESSDTCYLLSCPPAALSLQDCTLNGQILVLRLVKIHRLTYCLRFNIAICDRRVIRSFCFTG